MFSAIIFSPNGRYSATGQAHSPEVATQRASQAFLEKAGDSTSTVKATYRESDGVIFVGGTACGHVWEEYLVDTDELLPEDERTTLTDFEYYPDPNDH